MNRSAIRKHRATEDERPSFHDPEAGPPSGSASSHVSVFVARFEVLEVRTIFPYSREERPFLGVSEAEILPLRRGPQQEHAEKQLTV